MGAKRPKNLVSINKGSLYMPLTFCFMGARLSKNELKKNCVYLKGTLGHIQDG